MRAVRILSLQTFFSKQINGKTMTSWFYFDGEKKQCGPVSADIIKQLIKQGILAPNAPLIGEDGKTSTTADKIDAQKPSYIGCGCLILLFVFIFFAMRPACRTAPETPITDSPAIIKRDPPKEYVVEKSGTDLMDWQIEVRIGWELDNNRIREIADSVTSKYLQQSFLATVMFHYGNDVFAVVKYQKGKFSEADFVFDRKRAEEQKRHEEEAAKKREEDRVKEEKRIVAEKLAAEEKLKKEKEKKQKEAEEKERSDRLGPGNSIDARVMAQEFVQERLKYPHDASFQWGTQSKEAGTTTEGLQIWKVWGKVKAANSFGAKLTYEYEVKLYCDKNKKWHLLSVSGLDSK